MSIDWLEAENAIDAQAEQEAHRRELEQRVQQEPVERADVLELLDVMDALEEDPKLMLPIAEWGNKHWANDGDMRSWQGMLMLRCGKVEPALKELNAAIVLAKHQPIARLTRGQIYLRTERFDKALWDFEAGLQGEPNERFHDELERMRIVGLSRVGRMEDAIAAQQERAKRKPDDVQNLIDGADLLEMNDRTDEARALLERLVGERPWDTDLLFQCAIRHFERDEHAAAQNLATKLLKIDGQHLEGWNLRSQVHYRLGSYEDALFDHSMIDELSKNMAPDQVFRARCHLGLGHKEYAIACLEAGENDQRATPDQRMACKRFLDDVRAGRAGIG